MSRSKVASIVAAVTAVLTLILSGCAASTSTGAPADTGGGNQPASAAPQQPAGTTSQMNALAAAQNYLSMDSGFSKAGLIQQLSSKYGDAYSKADATWAVAHCGADWNAQAVLAAKTYLATSPFSRSGLISQLSSSYGSGFTRAQATYAANQVGLK